ncbi:MAG: hypothetical protein WBC48_00255, partial [Minisyncoccales bacterium]
VSLLRGTKRMRSPEETSSGCGGVNTSTQEPNLLRVSSGCRYAGCRYAGLAVKASCFIMRISE